MKKPTQKALALLLAVLMVTALLPTGVLAAGEDTAWNVSITNPNTGMATSEATVTVGTPAAFPISASTGDFSSYQPYNGEFDAYSVNPDVATVKVQRDVYDEGYELVITGVKEGTTKVNVSTKTGTGEAILDVTVEEGGTTPGGDSNYVLQGVDGSLVGSSLEMQMGSEPVMLYVFDSTAGQPYSGQIGAYSNNEGVVRASEPQPMEGTYVVTLTAKGEGTTTVYVMISEELMIPLTVKVTAGGGTDEPTGVTSVTIEGEGKVGTTLTAVVEPEGVKATYQWYNGWDPISGATNRTYNITNDCVGMTIRVSATGSDGEERMSTNSVTVTADAGGDEPTPPTPDKTPLTSVIITNQPPKVNKELAAQVSPAGATVTYQWYTVENDTETKIELATSATYTPTTDDVGKKIKVQATGIGDYEGVQSVTTFQATEDVDNVTVTVSGAVADEVANILQITTSTQGESDAYPRRGTPEGIYAVENDTVTVIATLPKNQLAAYQVKEITVTGADDTKIEDSKTTGGQPVVNGKKATFTKGAATVQVVITVEKLVDVEDPTLLAALTAIQGATYGTASSDCPDAATAKTIAEDRVAYNLELNNITGVDYTVTAGEYHPATETTLGTYTFTVTLTKDGKSVTTTELVMNIYYDGGSTPTDVMTLTPDSVSVKVGETATSTLQIMGAEGAITVASSDEAVATAVCSVSHTDELKNLPETPEEGEEPPAIDPNAPTGTTTTITVTGKKAGTATITVTLTAANGASASVELAVTVTGGSSSGPAPSRPSAGTTPSTTTEKTENADGSVTTTVTDSKTGKVTETTKFEDGTTVETVTEPEKDTTVSVTLPKGTEKAVVTIPVDVDYSTVLVDADGNVIKGAVPTENLDGIQVAVEGDAKLTLVKRENEFVDVDGHWAEDSMDFAAAQELFKGVDDTHFAPDMSMTRGMLVTILARFDGQDTDSGENWYDVGAQWAADNKISDGTNLPEVITREQLVTMLYRYAQLKGVVVTEEATDEPTEDATDDKAADEATADEAKTEEATEDKAAEETTEEKTTEEVTDEKATEDATEEKTDAMSIFGDAASISDWASEAMTWAVNVGILEGTPDAQLLPQGVASRAQVSAMLLRFCRTLLK